MSNYTLHVIRMEREGWGEGGVWKNWDGRMKEDGGEDK